MCVYVGTPCVSVILFLTGTKGQDTPIILRWPPVSCGREPGTKPVLIPPAPGLCLMVFWEMVLSGGPWHFFCLFVYKLVLVGNSEHQDHSPFGGGVQQIWRCDSQRDNQNRSCGFSLWTVDGGRVHYQGTHIIIVHCEVFGFTMSFYLWKGNRFSLMLITWSFLFK